MKIFILFAILGMMLFSACTEQDIEPFGAVSYTHLTLPTN